MGELQSFRLPTNHFAMGPFGKEYHLPPTRRAENIPTRDSNVTQSVFHRFPDLPLEIKIRIYRFYFANNLFLSEWDYLQTYRSSRKYVDLVRESTHPNASSWGSFFRSRIQNASRPLKDWDAWHEETALSTFNLFIAMLARNVNLPTTLFPIIFEETAFCFEELGSFVQMGEFWQDGYIPWYNGIKFSPLAYITTLQLCLENPDSDDDFSSLKSIISDMKRLEILSILFRGFSSMLKSSSMRPYAYYLKAICAAKGLKSLAIAFHKSDVGGRVLPRTPYRNLYLEAFQHVLQRNCQDIFQGEDTSRYRLANKKMKCCHLQDKVAVEMNKYLSTRPLESGLVLTVDSEDGEFDDEDEESAWW